MNISAFDQSHAEEWEALIAESTSGTILQTRRFLGYHGDRFADASLCFWEGPKLIGVLPAARDPRDAQTVISHPGITFGGLMHRGKLRGTEMLAAMQGAVAHYAAEGYRAFRYKAVPRIYHRAPADDDLYALFRLGARRYRCDLWMAIDLSYRLEISSRRKRALKKALARGLTLSEDACHVSALWAVLEANLATKHGVTPVHSVAEITRLHSLFPDQIRFVTAHLANKVAAGVVLFLNETAVHTQYIASSEIGHEASALDFIFHWAICMAKDSNRRYFNFGNTCEEDGHILNDGLCRFKSEFGSAGIVHEFYEVQLL